MVNACRKRRPVDQAVWLAKLNLAMATGDQIEAARAVKQLTASWFLPFEVLRLRAWFAAFRGDDETERRTLLALTTEEPGNTTAWSRLAELALKAGRSSDALALRKNQANASDLRKRYTQLFMLDDRSRHADELAKVARDLGRKIEARGWSLIAQGQAANEPLWPVQKTEATSDGRAPALESLLVDLLPGANEVGSRPSPDTALTSPTFTDLATEAGLRFFHDNGHSGESVPPTEAMCGGVGLLDYDGDGWLDVYAVQGGPFPPTNSVRQDGDRLFKNRGDGTFTDVTQTARDRRVSEIIWPWSRRRRL